MKTKLMVAGAVLMTSLILVEVRADTVLETQMADKSARATTVLTGELNVVVVDYEDGRKHDTLYTLRTTKGEVNLHNFHGDHVAAGSTVVVEGLRDSSGLNVRSMSVIEGGSRTGATPLLGDRTVGVFYVDFNDVGLTTADIAEAEGAMYTDIYYPYFFIGDFTLFNEATVKSSLEEYSFGQLSINADADGDGEFDIHGPFAIDFPSTSCPTNSIAFSWSNAVDALAVAQGIDLSLYQHRVYILPDNACAFRGLGQLNCGDTCRAWSTLASPVHTITHELGHNFGLQHVGRDWNDDGVYAADETDANSLMGGGTGWGDPMTPQHRDHLGWFDAFPGAYLDISASGTGTYTIRDTGNLGAEPVGIRLQAFAGPFVHNFSFSYHQSKLAEFDVVLNYFDPIPSIADKVRIFQEFNTSTQDSIFMEELLPGESFLYDFNASGFRLGLWVETSTANSETTELSIYVGDTDGDGVYDYEDNCYLIANPAQYDADCDGFGNICDGDFNNDGVVNNLDTAIFSQNFLGSYDVTDMNGDGITNFLDYPLFTAMLLQSPGPAGPAAACSTP